MRELLLSMLPILRPLLETFISIAGPIFVTWITVRAVSLLKVNDEQKKMQIEGALRDALHRAAAEALKFAMVKYGVQGSAGHNLSDQIMYLAKKANERSVDGSGMAQARIDDIVATAVNEYLIPKMPDTIKKLNASSQDLSDIVLSKVSAV